MLADGILRPLLLQLPLVKYGSPVLPKYGPPPSFTPSPTFSPSWLPTTIPTPTPDLRDMLVFPLMAVILTVFVVIFAVFGFFWLSGRGKGKK